MTDGAKTDSASAIRRRLASLVLVFQTMLSSSSRPNLPETRQVLVERKAEVSVVSFFYKQIQRYSRYRNGRVLRCTEQQDAPQDPSLADRASQTYRAKKAEESPSLEGLNDNNSRLHGHGPAERLEADPKGERHRGKGTEVISILEFGIRNRCIHQNQSFHSYFRQNTSNRRSE